MKVFKAEVMRKFDRRAITEEGIPGVVLMERAAVCIVREFELFARGTHICDPEFLILSGRGNNGGDALASARILFEKGLRRIRLVLTAPPEKLSTDSLKMFERLPEELKKNISFELSSEDFTESTIVLDGLLGTGISGALREPFKTWIELVNESKAPVVSIDIPSGLNSDDGSAENAVRADLTVTMAAPKSGMFSEEGIRRTGRLAVADIGFPEKFFLDEKADFHVFGFSDARTLLNREAFDSFKNRRGHLCVAGGSKKYTGAPCLSAEAALRTGCGLVTLFLPEDADVLCSIPKALIVRRTDPETPADFASFAAVAAGPGMSREEEKLPLLEKILSSGKPLVLDADALNLVSDHPEIWEKRKNTEIVLTPHPGEAARLLHAFHIPPGSRRENAERLAKKLNSVIILKGARTITAAPDERITINLSGSPALATAGSGDVLTGICGAFLAMGFPAFEAAQLASFVHGGLGEALCPCGSRGILSDDLPKEIPYLLKKILPIF